MRCGPGGCRSGLQREDLQRLTRTQALELVRVQLEQRDLRRRPQRKWSRNKRNKDTRSSQKRKTKSSLTMKPHLLLKATARKWLARNANRKLWTWVGGRAKAEVSPSCRRGDAAQETDHRATGGGREADRSDRTGRPSEREHASKTVTRETAFNAHCHAAAAPRGSTTKTTCT